MGTIELAAIDLRYENTRQRDEAAERRLMSSIMERDIQQPLSVAFCDTTKAYVLLDGFKRYRCARKLGLGMVPAECIAGDVITGMLIILRRSYSGSNLGSLEQAAIIEDLHKRSGLSIYEIATRLGRSPSWVSMRLGMLEQLSPLVREKIMAGVFPVRVYMYGIKGFTRVNNIASERVDRFVESVSGKSLSTRELFVLCRWFFSGTAVIEDMILHGDIHRAVRMCTGSNDEDRALNTQQRSLVDDLSAISTSMERVVSSASTIHYESGYFTQCVNFWTCKIRMYQERFREITEELYDRCQPPGGSADIIPTGSEQEKNSAEPSL